MLDAWRERRAERRSGAPRVRKFRLLLIFSGLGVLALISTVFGMMMAVASDVTDLENAKIFANSTKRNSKLVDIRGRPLGILTGNENVVLVGYGDIAPVMRQAIIAIEDERFYSNPGVDIQGIGRAFVQDVIQRRAAQGGSTITQQFVKNALEAQGDRTVFQKLRESATAYHLTRKWSKRKILTEYLNSIYFGNGAYGIEQAARVYFGNSHPGCGTEGQPKCAALLTAAEAASLAGMVASPSGYDPATNPKDFLARRNLVLDKMLEQDAITEADHARAVAEAPVTKYDITPPDEKSESPFFTSWVRQLVVDSLGAEKAFYGNLTVRTTLDLDLQAAAEQAVDNRLTGLGPTAALVAIENETGEVRAMVGGQDYEESSFNLATQGQRQPGSSFKPFILAAALQDGIAAESVWSSAPKEFPIPNTKPRESFVVNNYEGSYTGSNTLSGAMTTSDNSIYAEVGLKVGTKRVAQVAREAGIRTPISTNYAMTLGGLKEGVTPLDMAHAYETFATGGRRVVNDALGTSDGGPIGIHDIRDADGDLVEVRDDDGDLVKATNEPEYQRVMPPGVAANVEAILESVVESGTGTNADIGDLAAGKTGTTENYGDAWFVGWNEKYTTAVWVGYADKVVPMETEYGGAPVAGGTYPSLIWADFMLAARGIDAQRALEEDAADGEESSEDEVDAAAATVVPTTPAEPAAPVDPTTTAPAPVAEPTTEAPVPAAPAPEPEPTPAPTPAPAPAPTPTPAPPATTGTTGGAEPPVP